MGSRFLRWTITILAVAAAISQPPRSIAQTTIPVTGHAFDPSQGVVAGMGIKFELYNCGSNTPRVVGLFGIVKQNFTLTPDTNGLITGTIVPNDRINCGGVAGTTRYWITPLLDGVPQTLKACYAVLSSMGTFNLDTATPCTSATPPPPPGGPYDATYANLNVMGLLSGGNGLFSGTIQAHQFRLDFTPTPCGAGAFQTGYNADLTVICGTPPAATIISFAGRGGTVVPLTGDYSCGMVTGAICSLPTVNYQTVQQGGTSQTARAKLNLIQSGQTTVTCVDNPGANSTDCTIGSTGADSATICNANGCYYTKADGTLVEWGLSTAFAGGSPGANVSVTFPHTFTTSVGGVQTNPDDCNSNNCGTNSALASNPSGVTTSGMTIHLSSAVLVGGAGTNITGTIHAWWSATGK
jgi:hypothetical protein